MSIRLKRVQQVLAERPGERLYGHQIAAAIGVTTRAFQRQASELTRRGHVSRDKVRDGGLLYYRYWLNDQQLEQYQRRAGISLGSFGLVAETTDIPARLRFLRHLQVNTIFKDHATLAHIIDDYERTLRLRKMAMDVMEANP